MREEAVPFESATGFLLALLGSLAGRSWHGMLQEHGLSPHEHAVLLTLRANGQLGQQSLGPRIGVDPRNLVAIIDGLEAKQLVQRTVDAADRRRRLLDLTPPGQAAAEELAVAAAAIEADFLRGLTPPEQQTLNRLLRRLRTSLETAV